MFSTTVSLLLIAVLVGVAGSVVWVLTTARNRKASSSLVWSVGGRDRHLGPSETSPPVTIRSGSPASMPSVNDSGSFGGLAQRERAVPTDGISLTGIEARLREELAALRAEAEQLQRERGELYRTAAAYAAEFQRQQRSLEEERRRLEEERKRLLVEARSYAEELQREAQARRREWQEANERIARLEKELERRRDELRERESRIAAEELRVQALVGEATEKVEESRARLELVAGLSREEALRLLKDELREEAELEAVGYLRDLQSRVQQSAREQAWRILATAMQRVAPEVVERLPVAEVRLPSEDSKGRIIGKDGRNIRTFEAVTGTELVIDDSHEDVLISCHDAIRREKARICLEELVADGRIHPSRIEEAYRRASAAVEAEIYQAGEEAAMEFGFVDMDKELVKALGSLKFRTSYGQNVLAHLKETARFAWAIAEELGMDPKICARGALLHDIGKALPAGSGPHALAGARFARERGERLEVVHAIEAHHEEVPLRSVEAVVVQVADQMSGGRPGARREAVDQERYVERLTAIEALCKSHPGVREAYAFRSGRDVRVVVDPYKVSDSETVQLARALGRRIRDEGKVVGQVKITVTRELRVEEVVNGSRDSKRDSG